MIHILSPTLKGPVSTLFSYYWLTNVEICLCVLFFSVRVVHTLHLVILRGGVITCKVSGEAK